MSITQQEAEKAKAKESIVKYVRSHSMEKAILKFGVPRRTLFAWQKRWLEGGRTYQALINHSRRPKSHSKAHTEAELTLLRNLRRRNPNMGLQDFWLRAKSHGYARTLQGCEKALKRLGNPTQPKSSPSPTCKQHKTYEQMTRPGERVQIDVKYVPRACISLGYLEQYPFDRFYQYTAIDEYSRYRVLWGSREHNTFASAEFLKIVVSQLKTLGIEIEYVQTDNGAEFTKRLLADDDDKKSLFELTASRLNIQVKYIKPHTPKHNGKVERSHREDQKLLYSEVIRQQKPFVSFDDFKQRLKRHQDKTNNRPMRPLGLLSPNDFLQQYYVKHKPYNH